MILRCFSPLYTFIFSKVIEKEKKMGGKYSRMCTFSGEEVSKVISFLNVRDKFEVLSFSGWGAASRISLKVSVEVIFDMFWAFKVVDFNNG